MGKSNKHFVHVFVYGSLKRGHGNNSLLVRSKAEFLGYDSVSGPLSMFSMGGFPGVATDSKIKGAPSIFGQVYRVPGPGLDALDALEGHPRWYKRVQMVTDILGIKAWIYLQPEAAIENYGADMVDRNMWRCKEDEAEFWKTHHDLKFEVWKAA